MIEYELRIKRGEQAASEILARGRSGRNIIDAIKAMRNTSGITLREAKDHVDRMMFRQPAEAVRAAPEAVSEARIAGALFDFLGFLTTSEEQWKFSAYDDASPAVYALEQWADKRGFALEPCDVSGWRATTEAATQPVKVATPLTEAELSGCMEAANYTYKPTAFAMEVQRAFAEKNGIKLATRASAGEAQS